MNTPWSSSEWRRVAVYGLGISGRAAVAYLRRRGVEVVAFDDGSPDRAALGLLTADPGVELVFGEVPRGLPAGIDAVVVSPGIPPERPLLAAARRRGLPVIAEVELAFPFLDGEVVAITGSNGKSTTTALAGEMLRAAGRTVEVCGNIGDALAARIEGPPGRTFVVELSSFQLEAVDRFHPRAAALLNLSADHLDRHRDLDAYLAVKAAIFRRQEASDTAVLNARDPRVRRLEVTSRRRFFASRGTVEDGCHLAGGAVVEVRPGAEPVELFRPEDLPLPGPHNLENAMAAALLARACGAPTAAVAAGVRGFRGLPHRLERVRRRRGVAWYDDSKGTNPAATARSLESFADGSVHLILGGRFKGGELDTLCRLAAAKARRAYLIGESATRFARALDGAVPLEPAGILERAVAAAAERAQEGETVLLSPACSSFDQFRNFAHRGRVFQRAVRARAAADEAQDTLRRGGDLGAQAGL